MSLDEVPIHPKSVLSNEEVPIHNHHHRGPQAIIVDMTDTEPAVVEEDTPTKGIDRRSKMVDRQRAVRQVLCYICCAEFGTNSLKIHHKTCIKKHAWGLENVAHEEGVNKKTAEKHRKMCTEPGEGPELAIPSIKCSAAVFEAYNNSAMEIFMHHSEHCWWCREKNLEAIEELVRRRQLQNEEEMRRRRAGELLLDEEQRRQRDRERLESVRMGEEDEFCAWWQRNKKKVPQGQHTFLHKHEGTLAAHVGAKVFHQKEADATSKAAVKDYSITRAKKDGLLPDQDGIYHGVNGSPQNKINAIISTQPEVTFTEVEVTAEVAVAMKAEEAQMNPGGVSSIITSCESVTSTATTAATAATVLVVDPVHLIENHAIMPTREVVN